MSAETLWETPEALFADDPDRATGLEAIATVMRGAGERPWPATLDALADTVREERARHDEIFATELRALARRLGALRATVGIELLLPLVEHIVPGIYQWLDPQLFDAESHNAFDRDASCRDVSLVEHARQDWGFRQQQCHSYMQMRIAALPGVRGVRRPVKCEQLPAVFQTELIPVFPGVHAIRSIGDGIVSDNLESLPQGEIHRRRRRRAQPQGIAVVE